MNESLPPESAKLSPDLPPRSADLSREPPFWQRWLYLATTLLLLLPLWTVARVPTVDGPTHLYTTWILRHLHDPGQPLIASTFEGVFAPVPNWLVQVLLYPLLGLTSAPVAEKLL
ncbi:MAG TPA: hypothetical protein VGS57_09575, partial [Thermoanaerobaculia bacterium]|nr:hypothetical protein [Thermoanaerobaculia bacterium]